MTPFMSGVLGFAQCPCRIILCVCAQPHGSHTERGGAWHPVQEAELEVDHAARRRPLRRQGEGRAWPKQGPAVDGSTQSLAERWCVVER